MADKDTPEAKNPPADNNKRLAFVEAELPKLATSVLALGAIIKPDDERELGVDEDPIVFVQSVLTELTEDQAELHDRLRNVLVTCELIEEDNAEREVAVACSEIKRMFDALENAPAPTPDEKDNRIVELEGKIANLEDDLEAARVEANKAQRADAAKPRRKKKSVKARKVGALDPKKVISRQALKELLEAGTEFEIVLSNGTSEIIEFEPVYAKSPAFHKRGGSGIDLIEPLIVRGAGTEHRVRGVGLFADGKQIAWTEFPSPVKVPIGQEVRFDRMLCFKTAS